jgi:hypothetical protein
MQHKALTRNNNIHRTMENVDQEFLNSELPEGTIVRASERPLVMHHEREVDERKRRDDLDSVRFFVEIDLSGMKVREALQDGAAQLWRDHVNGFRQYEIDDPTDLEMLEDHRHDHLVRDENDHLIEESYNGDRFNVIRIHHGEIGSYMTEEARKQQQLDALIQEYGSKEAVLDALTS